MKKINFKFPTFQTGTSLRRIRPCKRTPLHVHPRNPRNFFFITARQYRCPPQIPLAKILRIKFNTFMN